MYIVIRVNCTLLIKQEFIIKLLNYNKQELIFKY